MFFLLHIFLKFSLVLWFLIVFVLKKRGASLSFSKCGVFLVRKISFEIDLIAYCFSMS